MNNNNNKFIKINFHKYFVVHKNHYKRLLSLIQKFNKNKNYKNSKN